MSVETPWHQGYLNYVSTPRRAGKQAFIDATVFTTALFNKSLIITCSTEEHAHRKVFSRVW